MHRTVVLQDAFSHYAKGSMRGGIPRIHYGWMKPGSYTRKRFEKMRNPFVDLETGTSLYYRDQREHREAQAHERDAKGLKSMDSTMDLYNEYKIVPDLYPEGFQWRHKLNTEYNQWRSNTWVTPDLIPPEHRGRFLCNFQLNVGEYSMKVAKFSPVDHRQWIRCILYVGTGKGMAGWGQSVAPSTNEAKKEAIKDAFSNVIGWDLEQDGPMYPVRINADGMRMLFYPSKKLVCYFAIADILCAFGIQCAGMKFNLSRSNRPKGLKYMYQGTFDCIRTYRTVNEIAASRGKIPHSLIYNIFPYLEEVRRRKGMMAMHPPGKDGMLVPDRVVDNRMPDHLKKGYYDDVYWKDFFAGDQSQLNEPKMGLRGDQLRKLVPDQRKRAGNQRKTLADVLSRMGRNRNDVGGLEIINTSMDAKVSTQMKKAFKLH